MGSEGNCRENTCSVISSLRYHIDRLFVIIHYYEEGLQFKFLSVVKGEAEVSLKPAGSWLPLAQNTLHTTEVHLGVPRSETLQDKDKGNGTASQRHAKLCFFVVLGVF